MPTFSIIIPVYGVERYIHKCLDSILNQDFTDWEAILIDDGSLDASGKICDEYAEKDNRFIVIHKENGGVSSARNAGLDRASGTWIWFIDPDDWISENALSILAECINDTECDTIFFGIEYFDESNNLVGKEDRIPQKSTSKDEAISCADYPPQNYLLKKEIVDRHHLKFSVGIPTGEDLEYQYKYLMLCQKPISIGNRLYKYLRRNGSAMRSEKSQINNAIHSIEILEHLTEFILQNNINETKWLACRLNRAFKNVLSSNAIVKRYDSRVQRSFRYCFHSLRYRGFSDFIDSAIKIGNIDMRLYTLYFHIRKFIKNRGRSAVIA